MNKLEIKEYDEKFDFVYKRISSIILLFIVECKRFKYYFNSFLFICFTCFILYNKFKYRNLIELRAFKKYARDCKKSINYNLNKIYKKKPYVTICISALNMEKYIKRNLLSIINQSFQDFAIIIVDDKSTDKTGNIIKKLQINDERIKVISHSKNLGVYHSRIESILNSNSKYIILMDPDDMYMNENLLKQLYNSNLKKNFDIIEFSVFQQNENSNKIYIPDNDFENHYHKFSKDIIYQPELSEILFYLPGTNIVSKTICRTIWNKIIRRELLIKTYNYIGKEYYDDYVITADDMLMNIISYQFANNYTNSFLPGYLYIIRKVSMSRGNGGDKLDQARSINFFLYFEIFYKYVKEYNKNRDFLFFEMKDLNYYILNIKKCYPKYLLKEINLIESLIEDKLISDEFKDYLMNLLIYLKK